MGMTIAEKILARASSNKKVSPGEIVTAKLDYCMANDATMHINIDIHNQVKNKRVFDKNKVIFVMDHNMPADNVKTAQVHKKQKSFCAENGIKVYDGNGVCHQLMIENHVCPGQLVAGADSHTCSYGGIGAMGIGIGSTDFVAAMNTGELWLMVSETLRFELSGKFKKNVYARDLVLKILGDIGANGANYKVMEYGGPAAKNLTIDDRIVLCNMAVEGGAKSGIFEPDEITEEYMKSRNRKEYELYKSDDDAKFLKTYNYDLSKIEPMVAKPHFVDNVAAVSKVKDVSIDQAFIGSCNNGRIEELRVASEILKGRKVKAGVKLLISPASREVYLQALKEGLMDIFMESGGVVLNPNCSVCWGACQGVIAEGETLISTGTRNFKGRAGHPNSNVYLASAATVAASAITGKITDPRKE